MATCYFDTVKKAASERCYHCDEICDPQHTYTEIIDGTERHFCCHGCLSACLIIYGAGEGSYYKKRSAPAPKLFDALDTGDAAITGTYVAPESRSKVNRTFDLPSIMEEYAEPAGDGLLRIRMSIEGIHCSSCVYLNEKILGKTRGVHEAQVNYDTGRATIVFDPEVLKVSSIIETVQSIGYNAVPIRPGQKSDSMQQEGKDLLWRLVVAGFLAGNVMLIAVALFFNVFDQTMTPVLKKFFHWLEFILATPAFMFSGAVFHRGWKSFLRTGMAGMDMLISTGISIAYFYSVYVVLSDSGEVYFDSVTTIIFFLLVGRYFEWMAKYRQRIRMEDLIKPLPAHCTRIRNGQEDVIAARELNKGDTVLVTTGNMLPADGTLLDETCEVDESVLTGESLPVIRKKGDRLLAGSLIVSGSATYRVTSLPHESSLSILSRLADSTGINRSRIERVTLDIIPWFSSVILVISALTFLFWFFYLEKDIRTAMTASISVLIVSCPCALALSVPTAIGSAIYLGLTNGILVRDGAVLESLGTIKKFFFDKTGTLTRGRPDVIDQRFFSAESEILSLVEFMETGSAHPVGRSLLEIIRTRREKGSFVREKLNFPVNSLEEHPGRGISLEWKGHRYYLGNRSHLMETGASASEIDSFESDNKGSTIVGLSNGKRLLALFALKDIPEKSTLVTLNWLRKRGVEIHMLTGDNREAANRIAHEISIPRANVHAELLPVDKEKIVGEIVDSGERAAMVGDGYNDAIALSRANVSVVLARGAPLSLEHAGIILLHNNLEGVIGAARLSKKARRTIFLNLGMSLLYNSVMIPIAAAGLLLPIWCSLFMSLSSLTVVGISIALRISGLKTEYDNG